MLPDCITRNMKNEKKFPVAEAKAIYNFAKRTYKVAADDSDYVMRIKLHLNLIDSVLKTGDLEYVLLCNKQIFNEYSSLLLRKGFSEANIDNLRSKGLHVNILILQRMGDVLKSEINIMKFWQGIGVGLSTGLEYLFDKQRENIVE